MNKVKISNLARAGVVAVALVMFSSASSFAQNAPKPSKSKREYIQATAQGTSTQMGRMISIQITIEDYSTPEDQQALLEAFQQKGQEGLFRAVEKMKAKGRMAITGTLGYDINYIREFRMPDGSRKIRLVTDRPIRFGEAWADTRSSDYNLSAAEIILSPQKSKNSGTLLPACMFNFDKEDGLEIETYQNPWELVNIKVWK